MTSLSLHLLTLDVLDRQGVKQITAQKAYVYFWGGKSKWVNGFII